MSHTPGPWEVDERGGGVVRSVNPEVGRQFARGWGQPQVALAIGMSERPDGEQIANARLIAAAPELLEAAERLLEHFSDGLPATLIEAFRAAVAKAKGTKT